MRRLPLLSILPVLLGIHSWEPGTARADGQPRFELINAYTQSPEHPAPGSICVINDLGSGTSIYAATSHGGSHGYGALLRFGGSTPTSVVNFTGVTGTAKGAFPSGGLLYTGGYMWGVTTKGGAGDGGTIYKYNPSSGGITTVVELGSYASGDSRYIGRNPVFGLVSDNNGKLWGVSGGPQPVVFKIDTSTNVATPVGALSALGSMLGSKPCGELVFDGTDSLWCATSDGGPNSYGRVFKIHRATNAVTTVTTFSGSTSSPAGRTPLGGLTRDSSGGMLGLSLAGSVATYAGQIYRIAISNNAFAVQDTISKYEEMDAVKGALVDIGGGYYGCMGTGPLSESDGALFIWGPGKTVPKRMVPFTASKSYGAYPVSIVKYQDGFLYGLCREGGDYDKGQMFYYDVYNSQLRASTKLGSSADPEISNGSQPAGGLTEGPDGRLWGLTRSGGRFQGGGTAYRFSPTDDAVGLVYNFGGAEGFFSGSQLTGRHPVDELAIPPPDQHGNRFYWGLTSAKAGSGSEFDMATGTLFAFNEPNRTPYLAHTIKTLDTTQSQPLGGLTVGSQTSVWGAATSDVFVFACDALYYSFRFILSPAHFDQATYLPAGGMTRDPVQSYLWGVTKQGGNNNCGIIYKSLDSITGVGGNVTSSFNKIAHFTGTSGSARGSRPNNHLWLDGSGFVWGTTEAGGSTDKGTLFKASMNTGAVTTIATFDDLPGSVRGSTPLAGLTPDGRGFLWGTTSAGGANGLGTIFRIHQTTLAFETMFEFTGATTGGTVPGGRSAGRLLLHSDGNLYGTTPGPALSKDNQLRSGGNIFRIRFGSRRMEARIENTKLVDGVKVDQIIPGLFKNVSDVDDSREVTVTVTNRSTTPLTGFTAAITGPYASDYTLTGPVPATLNPNQVATFKLTFDPADEGDRNAVLIFGENSPDTDSYAIPLDGVAVKRTISVAPTLQVAESSAAVPLQVLLSQPLNKAVSIPFTVKPGTASSADYSVSKSPVTIAAGATSGLIWITPKKDYIVEGPESLTIELGTPSSAAVKLGVTASTAVEISDDDSLPSFGFGQGGLVSPGTALNVDSSLINPSNMPFTGKWTRNGKTITGANQPVYRIASANAADAGTYQFTLKTAGGVTVSCEPIEVIVLTSEPQWASFGEGTTALLPIVAAGNNLTFRWTHTVNEEEVPVVDGGRITDATTSRLKISGVTSADAGLYYLYCAISGSELSPVPITLRVHNAVPQPTAPAFPATMVCKPFSYFLPRTGGDEAAPSSITASGLPPGLVCNPMTGEIIGRATKSGRFKVTVTMSNSKGRASVTGYLDVAELPSYLPGTFTGFLAPGNYCPFGARIDFTTTKNGMMSGSLLIGASKRRFLGQLTIDDNGPTMGQISIPLANNSALAAWLIEVQFTPEGTFGGNYTTGTEGSTLNGWRNVWHATSKPASHLDRYHTFVIEHGLVAGYGYGSVTLELNGTIAIAGRLPDDTAFSSSCTLSPGNNVFSYSSLYSKQGGLYLGGGFDPHVLPDKPLDLFGGTGGAWAIPMRAASNRFHNSPLENVVANPTFKGGSYRKPGAGTNVLGLPVVPAGTQNAQFIFGISGVIVPTAPYATGRISPPQTVSLPASGSAENPSRISKVSLNAGTGLFSGGFTEDYGTANARSSTFKGIVVPTEGKGFGYFTIAEPANPNAAPPTTTKTSPMASGTVELQPYAAP